MIGTGVREVELEVELPGEVRVAVALGERDAHLDQPCTFHVVSHQFIGEVRVFFLVGLVNHAREFGVLHIDQLLLFEGASRSGDPGRKRRVWKDKYH